MQTFEEWVVKHTCLKWPNRFLALVVALPLSLVFGYLATPPATAMTPYWILEFQFAGTRDGALAILRAWQALPNQHIGAVCTSLLLDFGFIICYVLLLVTVLTWLAGTLTLTAQPSLLYNAAGWSALWAGVFDAIENLALLSLLSVDVAAAPAWVGLVAFVGAIAALVKWTLVSCAVLYGLWLVWVAIWRYWLRGFVERVCICLRGVLDVCIADHPSRD